MSVGPTLVSLDATHAETAARLHMEGQPGTFLTRLGGEVLTVLYRTLPSSAGGFGYAAVAQPQELLGFVSATTQVGSLFWEMGTRRLPALLPPLLRRFVRNPALALLALQTVTYPLLHPADAVPAAELLSIMVRSDLRGEGIGALLLAALRAECQRRALPALEVTVAAANSGAQRFYQRHGFVCTQRFVLYGQPMYRYRAVLSP